MNTDTKKILGKTVANQISAIIEWDITQECKAGLTGNNQPVMHHSNRIKDENYMTISVEQKKNI